MVNVKLILHPCICAVFYFLMWAFGQKSLHRSGHVLSDESLSDWNPAQILMCWNPLFTCYGFQHLNQGISRMSSRSVAVLQRLTLQWWFPFHIFSSSNFMIPFAVLIFYIHLKMIKPVSNSILFTILFFVSDITFTRTTSTSGCRCLSAYQFPKASSILTEASTPICF